MGLYAGVDYNLIICPLQSRLQHIYHGHPYARVDLIPQSVTLELASEGSPSLETQGTEENSVGSFISILPEKEI
jgi:hypothetical protein